ncbi:hypothetical protein [Alicyclobacillus dauci]|uniref:Uncharacterized protein n=1 Tax=Alicyclobacillus dauci TaxID=1475485 RepID=A0ABY6Z6Q7_9BACL|nr:hypothetical protein [Alicyclobacillus dauci]WAH38208.1 hypothetical protein NZD86_06910 [Alicyclobacillus dauci]
MPGKLEHGTLVGETALTDPDKWYRVYEELSEGERYDWIIGTLDRTLDPDFFEKLSFADYIFELADRKNPEKYAELIHKLRHHRDFYREEFQYFENELAAYHLFLDEVSDAEESLRYYMGAPVQGIDQLIWLMKLLVYYGKTDLAIECARQTYQEIEASPELIGGAEEPFADLIFMCRFQQAYLRIKNGQGVDWRAVQEELERYDIAMDDEILERNRAAMERPSTGDEILCDGPFNSENGPGVFARDNMWTFVKQMLDRKQMDFPLGEAIWAGAFQFLLQRKARKRPVLTWGEWFEFSERELDAYLARMVGGFLSTRQTEAFAVLWGMAYVYDFLLERGVISDKLHINALQRIARVKSKIRDVYQDELWKYAFVDRWQASDYAGRESMQTEDDEDDNLDLNDIEDDDYDPDFYDTDRDEVFSNPFFGAPLQEHDGSCSAKVKQKKKKARKEAKKQRKRNRR